jgi:hypothetical protein
MRTVCKVLNFVSGLRKIWSVVHHYKVWIPLPLRHGDSSLTPQKTMNLKNKQFVPQYSRNIAMVDVKHQSINQSINHFTK